MLLKAICTFLSLALVALALPYSDVAEVPIDSTALHQLETRAIKGKATYYEPNGGTGACGKRLQNSDMIVALSADRYDNGAHCHKKLWARYNGKKIAVTVEDLCPGCAKSSLDLSRAAFQQLANLEEGVFDVEWWFD